MNWFVLWKSSQPSPRGMQILLGHTVLLGMGASNLKVCVSSVWDFDIVSLLPSYLLGTGQGIEFELNLIIYSS